VETATVNGVVDLALKLVNVTGLSLIHKSKKPVYKAM
jgi:hypothetical protein